MDEYDQEFQRAWAVDHTLTGDRLSWPKGGWAEGNSYQPTHYPLCCTAALNRIVPNYALDVQGEKLEADVSVDRQAMPATWDWQLASPLKLRTNAVVCDWTLTPTSPLPAAPIADQVPRRESR